MEEFLFPTTEEINEIERVCFEPEDFPVSEEITKLEDLETRSNRLLNLDADGICYWDYKESKCRYHGHKSVAYTKLKRKIASLVGLHIKTVYNSLKNDVELKTLYTDRTVEQILEYNVTTKTQLDKDGNVIRADLSYTCYRQGDRRYEITDNYYIHPETNILCKTVFKEEVRQPKPKTKIKLNDLNYHQKINGIWYHTTYKIISVDHWSRFSGMYSIPEERLDGKKQLTTKELRKFNLEND